ncbi:MAG: hypothetical protein HUJ26_12530 [Planctomycetaceae bacterium]|nr:hypothetical protein [Planctomycetaceae bacterium]
MTDESEKKTRSLGCGIAAFIGLPLLYALSTPFAISFGLHMDEWFGIDVEPFFSTIYYPIGILMQSSDSFNNFIWWYIELFPSWFYGPGWPGIPP